MKSNLNEAEKLSIKRLRLKGLTYVEIAARIGCYVYMVKMVCNPLRHTK